MKGTGKNNRWKNIAGKRHVYDGGRWVDWFTWKDEQPTSYIKHRGDRGIGKALFRKG
jgi:hypothetical protein